MNKVTPLTTTVEANVAHQHFIADAKLLVEMILSDKRVLSFLFLGIALAVPTVKNTRRDYKYPEGRSSIICSCLYVPF